MQKQHLFSLILAAAVALPGAVLASGSYTARPPRPPVRTDGGERLDSARYELGKRVYNKKSTLGTVSGQTGQDERLRAIESRLPEKEQKKANLTSLAGKLTAEQLDALDYYVTHRFPHQ
jgi:hypothetical protein